MKKKKKKEDALSLLPQPYRKLVEKLADREPLLLAKGIPLSHFNQAFCCWKEEPPGLVVSLPVEVVPAILPAPADVREVIKQAIEVEPEILEHVPVVAAALEVADDLDELQQLLRGYPKTDVVIDLVKDTQPKWASSLVKMVELLAQQEKPDIRLLARKIKKAPLHDRVEAALRAKQLALKADDLYEEAMQEFYKQLYADKKLVQKLFSITDPEAYQAPTRLWKTAQFRRIVGPQWVIVSPNQELGIMVVDKLTGRRIGKDGVVDLPIVKLERQLKSVEEAIDLLAEDTYFLRSQKGYTVIISGLFGEIYLIDPNGQVITIDWSEYARLGLSFIANYLPIDDTILYVARQPRGKTLKIFLSPEKIAGLIVKFGLKPEEIFEQEDVAAIMQRYVEAIKNTKKQEEEVYEQGKEAAEISEGSLGKEDGRTL